MIPTRMLPRNLEHCHQFSARNVHCMHCTLFFSHWSFEHGHAPNENTKWRMDDGYIPWSLHSGFHSIVCSVACIVQSCHLYCIPTWMMMMNFQVLVLCLQSLRRISMFMIVTVGLSSGWDVQLIGHVLCQLEYEFWLHGCSLILVKSGRVLPI